jgi:hypothetical protein
MVQSLGMEAIIEFRGFWRSKAERRVEPERGSPEIKCILRLIKLFRRKKRKYAESVGHKQRHYS